MQEPIFFFADDPFMWNRIGAYADCRFADNDDDDG